jgi:hypothetical protein
MARKLSNGWYHAGTISIDSGLIFLGDPAYIFGKEASYRPKSWNDALDTIEERFDERRNKSSALLHPETEEEGLGIVLPTQGDGSINVYLRLEENRVTDVSFSMTEDLPAHLADEEIYSLE